LEHKREKYIFRNKQNKPISFITIPFTFEVDEYLEKRFPNYSSGATELTLKLTDVKKDMEYLLDGKTSNVAWEKQDYEDIMKVYAFFLTYKKNALLRQLEYNDSTLAMATNLAMKMMTTSIPQTGSGKN